MSGGVELTWVWAIPLISFVVGIGLGIGIAYLALGSCRRSRELKAKLDALQKEFDGYRSQVAEHFLKTSQLVQKMTSSYRDVYKHLATGSQSLCKEPLSTPRLDIAEDSTLTGKGQGRIRDDLASSGFSNGETDGLEGADADAFLGDSPRVPDLDTEGADERTRPRKRTPSP